jgi:hypothetical protein
VPSPVDIQAFIRDGFTRIDGAFSREIAGECRRILWRDTACDPHDRSTWTRPIVRLGSYTDPPFQQAAHAPALTQAFDQLVGPDRWWPRDGLGTFPIRFPSAEDPGDTGWHVDASYPPASGKDQPFSSWRINIRSRGRALLMLFLFSDVGPDDAPTRIRVGSHHEVARILAPAGEQGLSLMELAGQLHRTSACPETAATGKAGTVYLCHPFLVHAAQPHRGTQPRFLAQPPLALRKPLDLDGDDGDCPIAQSIRIAIGANDPPTLHRD